MYNENNDRLLVTDVDFITQDTQQVNQILYQTGIAEGGSPGLVVMGGDSCSKGREFESRHHTRWTFFHIY